MSTADDLLATVHDTASRLKSVSDVDASRRPAPGKWSAKEILGHLVDSAANNHARFVRAASQDDLIFPGYDQDAWVAAQDYQSAPWPDLVELWTNYNRHLARVMIAIPESTRMRPRLPHNLDETAWKPLPPNEPATLDYFMRDYVDHLKHHVGQIRALKLPGFD